MTRAIGSKWQVYHLVQPYFFAHHHFHKRKIDILRDNGINAKMLSIVPKDIYINNQSHYAKVENEDYIEIITVPHKNLTTFFFLVYLLKKLVRGDKILVHALRASPWALIILKKMRLYRSSLRYVQEYEGDTYSEFVYVKEFFEPSAPPEKARTLINRAKSFILLWFEKVQAQCADGLVLVSQEHAELWRKRLKKSLHTSILPTLPDPDVVFFDKKYREEIRKTLSIQDNLVLTYTGNVVCQWQRRDSMCRLVADLLRKEPRIRFLVVVRKDDIDLMIQSLKKYKIEDITVLKTVEHSDVYKYLSAADLALFLRHNHIMNKIVTSGKLGEYLAGGLPVLTTGNNAKVLNDFIRKSNSGIFLEDDLEIDGDVVKHIRKVMLEKDNLEIRKNRSQATKVEISNNAPFYSYAGFIRGLICN